VAEEVVTSELLSAKNKEIYREIPLKTLFL
jgi:hypothetical protein